MKPIRLSLNPSNPEKSGVDPVAREETLLAIEKVRDAAYLARYTRTHDDAVSELVQQPSHPVTEPVTVADESNVVPIKPEANPLFNEDRARKAVEDVWAA